MNPVKNTKDLVDKVIFLVPEILGKLFKGMSDCCDEVPLAHRKLMHALWFRGPLMMREISDSLSIETSTATALIDNLVKNGMVERERDQDDRRIVKVKLSQKGSAKFKEMRKKLEKHLLLMLDKLSEKKQKQVVNAFEDLQKILSEV